MQAGQPGVAGKQQAVLLPVAVQVEHDFRGGRLVDALNPGVQ